MRRLLLFLMISLLVVAACGQDDSGSSLVSSSVLSSTTEAPAQASTAASTTTSVAPSTTVPVWIPVWSRVPHDETVFGGEGDQILNGVTTGGPGLVAVGVDDSGGDSDAGVWTSTDGVEWLRVPHDETVFGGEGDQILNGVTTGGPGLVAAGSDGLVAGRDAAVWTSSDGVEWSRVPHDEDVFGGEGGQEISNLTVGGSGLVAVGWEAPADVHYAAVWTSPDGAQWSRVAKGTDSFGPFREMTSVAGTSERLAAVGFNALVIHAAAVWTSQDGTAWTQVAHDVTVFGSKEGYQWMWDVAWTPAGFVAVGADKFGGDVAAAVWASSDGLEWSRVPHDESILASGDMRGATAGGPGVVAVGLVQTGGDTNAAIWTAAIED